MRFPVRRPILFPAIVAAIVALGYFSISGHQGSAPHSSTTSVSIPSQSSIQGPYSSDQVSIAERIIAAINHTRRTLDIAVYSITQPDITSAIEAAHQRGVRIRIISDEGQSFGWHSEIAYLRSRGIHIRLSGGYRGQRSLMHNKFAIFDGSLVETGSFNWTTSANSYNFENAIFVADSEISARYQKEFDHIWALAR